MDNVKPLRDAQIGDALKQQMLDYVALMWDALAADGCRPACIVFALVSESGAGESSFLTDQAIDHHNSLHLSRAVMMINCDYQKWGSQ